MTSSLDQVSRVTAVVVISAILATSSLFLNIGVAEATHGGIHIDGGTFGNPLGTFVCPPPNSGTGAGAIGFNVQQQDNGQFEGHVEAPPIIGVGNQITSAETDGETFTIHGSPHRSCAEGTPPYTYTFTVTGECGTGVTVRVSVSNGATGTYQANIQCIAAANSAPTAIAGADQTVNEGDTVTLDGSASSDVDGTIASYSWTQTAGTSSVTLSDASSARPIFTAPDVGPEGDTLTFELTVTDNDGATSTTADTVNVIVQNIADTTPPDIIVPSGGITGEATSASGAQVNYDEVSTNDDIDGSATLNADGSTTQDDIGGDITISCAPAPGSTFPLGQTTVECTATDASDNTSPVSSFTVTVQDTTPPVISVPERITEEATGPDGAVVSFDDVVSAEDLVDGQVAVSCDHNSGDTFPLGETTVTCSAQDSRGNSAQGSFVIEVVDTTAPDVQITGAVDRTGREISDGGTTPIPYIRITFEASDAVGIDSRGTQCSLDGGEFTSCTSPQVYDRLSRGSHEVTVRATDAAGNTGQDEFSWAVSNPTGAAEGGEEQLAATTTAAEEEDQSLATEGGEEEEVIVAEEDEQQPSADNIEDDEQP